MNNNSLKVFTVLTISALFAIYLGFSAATESVTAVLWMIGIVGVSLVIALGKNVWMLVPPFLVLQGDLNALPGSPPCWALCAAVVFTMYALRYATGKRELKFRFGAIDFVIILQLVAVAQAWIRNPSGLLLFGGEVAGGKPYFVFCAAVLAYFVLSVTKPTVATLKYAVVSMIVVGIVDGLICIGCELSPVFAKSVLRIYGGNMGVLTQGSTFNIDEARAGTGFAVLGENVLVPLFCLVKPIKCIIPFYVVPFLVTCGGSALILLSGFRSVVAYTAVLYSAVALARRRILDIFAAMALGCVAILAVIGSGETSRLPFGVQRVLTVVGAKVRGDVKMTADDSTESRIEVWKTVLFQKGYIENKILGDGFNISAREQRAITASATQGIRTGMGLDNFVERCLATGSYHGFHVETIRFTGIFGLLAAITAMIIFFRAGLNQIRYYAGQPIFGHVLYICVPILMYLFWSLLVFGSYRFEFPVVMVTAGLVKMLDNMRSENGSRMGAN